MIMAGRSTRWAYPTPQPVGTAFRSGTLSLTASGTAGLVGPARDERVAGTVCRNEFLRRVVAAVPAAAVLVAGVMVGAIVVAAAAAATVVIATAAVVVGLDLAGAPATVALVPP